MSNKISYGLKYLIITLLLFCNAPWTAAQQPARKVTLNLENVSFENCLKAIERQTHYTFLYRKDLINLSKPVSFSCKDEALTAVLDSLLPSQNIAYRIQDLTIVLTPKQVRSKKTPTLIQGNIVDENKEPVIGASIKIKGTTQGTITDIDGNFSFEASLDDKVIISYVGLETIERKIGTKVMNIVMKDDAVSLGDVVVTGYQKINRKMFTGSASKVNADETVLKGNPDVTNSLQGKVAGVQITNVSSTFGASPVLTIRGNSSINGTNKPLWVVDGVILPNLRMDGEKEQCVFLNEQGRCRIHAMRPGLCRVFPLGRIYEEGRIRYFLQMDACQKPGRSKVKVGKWLDTPQMEQYERFLMDWHGLRKQLEKQVKDGIGEQEAKTINMFLLNLFFIKPYEPEQDFYEQYEERRAMAGQAGLK